MSSNLLFLKSDYVCQTIGNTKEGSFKLKTISYTSYSLKSKRPFYGFKIYAVAIYVLKKVYIRKQHLKLCLLGFGYYVLATTT